MADLCSALKKQLIHCILYAIVAFTSLFSYIYQPNEKLAHWKKVNSNDQESLTNCTNSGPLITFTGAGLLYGYYVGVVYFIMDHFDICRSKVKLSGISCGTTIVMCVFFDLTILQTFEMGRIWVKILAERKPIYFFLQSSQLINEVYDMMINDFGMDNEQTMKKQYEKYGENCLYLGASAIDYNCSIGKYELKPLMLHSFQTIKQYLYAVSVTMRILPFFKSVGYWNNKYCLDGTLSHKWADVDSNLYGSNNNGNTVAGDVKSQVIRVSVKCDCKEADICPNYGMFSSWDYMWPFITIEEDFRRFAHGYRSAAKLSVILNLIRKGMVWKEKNMREIFHLPSDMKFDFGLNWDEIKWQKYINKKLEQYEKIIIPHFHERES